MSKLTREQIDRAREQLGDGWVLDLRMATIWGRKIPVYRIEDEEIKTNEYGDVLHDPSGTYYPSIEVRHYVRDGRGGVSYYIGRGMEGMSFPIEEEPVRRRTFSRLARITRELTTEDLRWYVAKEAERRTQRGLAIA